MKHPHFIKLPVSKTPSFRLGMEETQYIHHLTKKLFYDILVDTVWQ